MARGRSRKEPPAPSTGGTTTLEPGEIPPEAEDPGAKTVWDVMNPPGSHKVNDGTGVGIGDDVEPVSFEETPIRCNGKGEETPKGKYRMYSKKILKLIIDSYKAFRKQQIMSTKAPPGKRAVFEYLGERYPDLGADMTRTELRASITNVMNWEKDIYKKSKEDPTPDKIIEHWLSNLGVVFDPD